VSDFLLNGKNVHNQNKLYPQTTLEDGLWVVRYQYIWNDRVQPLTSMWVLDIHIDTFLVHQYIWRSRVLLEDKVGDSWVYRLGGSILHLDPSVWLGPLSIDDLELNIRQDSRQ